MEATEKLIRNYAEYMTLSVLPEKIIRQCSSRSGFDFLKKGHEYLQKGEAQKAVECYRKAAEKGDMDALIALCICYRRGIGVPADLEQADATLEIAVRLREREMYEMMGVEVCDNQKGNSSILDREFINILFSAEEKEKIKRIVFGKRISAQALSGYYKDISADRDGSVIGWIEGTTLHIEAEGRVIAPESCKSLFSGMNIECFEWNDSFDTENVTDMRYMFSRCKNLEELDLSGFAAGNVIDMESMFQRCSKLKRLDLSGVITKNVTNMKDMFSGCEKLEELDLSGFDMGNADMSRMFYDCKKLKKLNLGGFDIRKVLYKYKRCMFAGCVSLPEQYKQL